MPLSRPLVRAEGVRIRHEGGERFTPDGASLEVRAGEVVLLLGPSGCGKSTFTLALNGLVPHAVPAELEGTVSIGGRPTTELTVAEASATVSMVFQDPDAQIVTGTVLDEVCFGPENLRVPVGEVLARAELALRQVGLWERRQENPDVLSGGGRQRLAIACALALRSPVIVLDEPTANLDPVGIDEVYAVLEVLVRQGGHALVLVEHDLDAAIGLVDRIVVLDHRGRPAFDGPAADVLQRHAEDLLALGVWLPTAVIAGLRLRRAGHRVDELPLTPEALTEVLDGLGGREAPGAHTDTDTDTDSARNQRLPAPPRSGEASSSPESRDRTGAAGDRAESPSASGAKGAATASAPATTGAHGAAVRVRGLRVARGGSEILHGIDLEIARGSFVAIVGTNGAGKTTLLQAMAGVVTPPRASVDLLGIDPARADVRTLARTVGFVFQNPEHQFVRHTVADELAHGLELQRAAPDEVRERVDRMLARFGLEEHRDVHPFLLSGGQKRRLSVGTALIAGAPLLALDEPTFGQDRQRSAELLDLLSDLNRAGTTVVVVTHDLQLVADHASHLVVLSDGAVSAHGTVDEVLASGAVEAAGLRRPALVRAVRAAADARWHPVTRLTRLEEVAGAFARQAEGERLARPAEGERLARPDAAGGLPGSDVSDSGVMP
ncbi:MAG: ABC transporter ATP-binding protein [Herbiconiux sp.]|uniref:ABC transporter ATP-binding protein n=1 Tax=Herbiconiux sp. TaxID=1871186 RepID=UPI001213E0D3|nr:ABC transporter ATP-binding protein [Herbiconiux sp.]TAJ49128.1 MAG: ABC transporter ATP-binding protein [Herbiconiux sp.]